MDDDDGATQHLPAVFCERSMVVGANVRSA